MRRVGSGGWRYLTILFSYVHRTMKSEESMGIPSIQVRTVLTGIVIPFPFVVKCYESDGDSGVRQCSACE